MDPATASPGASDRPASSPDPVPTRPNPFDDEHNSARKRRRTSPVDSSTHTSSSRSSSPAAAQDHPTTSSDTVMVHAEDADSPAAASTTMHVDPNPELPSTPEPSRPREPATEPPSSSRVTTINLRQRHGGLDGVASSPSASPGASSPSDGRDRLIRSDLNMPDVDSDQRRDSAPSGDDDTPTSSTLGASSPELVDGADKLPGARAGRPEEQEDVLAPEEQEVFDFFIFPFMSPNEPLPQVVGRILHFLDNSGSGSPGSDDVSDDNVITSVNEWLRKCVRWIQHLSLDRAIACVQGHNNFWAKIVELVMLLGNKRHKYPVYSQSRQLVNQFLQRAATLAAIFVSIDIKNLNRHKTDPDFAEAAAPQILSLNILQIFVQAVRLPRQAVLEDFPNAPLMEDTLGVVQAFVDASPGGGLGSLLKLIQMIESLTERYPKLADLTWSPVSAVAALLHETMNLTRADALAPIEARLRLAIGHQIFESAAEALSTSIDKHLTQLGPGRTENLVQSLGEMLVMTLKGNHPNAIERVKQHRLAYPGLIEQHIPIAISYEWRLSTLCKLIKCGQMQLRVMAVRMANEELVGAWKMYNNDEHGNRAFMRHLAAHLDSTHIVEYVLDPACHPEITGQSGNIVAFFVATGHFRDEHADLLWNSFAAAQDLRISSALQNLITPVLNLFHKSQFVYLFGKFQRLPMQDFSPAMRRLLDVAVLCFTSKVPLEHEYHQENEEYRAVVPNVLVRLLRESSVAGPGGRLASPEVHSVAQARFTDLVDRGLHPDVRRDIYTSCCSDIAAKTRTALGSMWVLAICLRQPRSADVPSLMQDYGLPRSMVEDLEHASQNVDKAEPKSVLTGPANTPRMQLLTTIVEYEPSAVPSDLCIRLLDALVGPKAVSQEDRDVGWHILNIAENNARTDNTFLSTCFTDYLPRITPDHIRPGTLDFVKRKLMKHVNLIKIPDPAQDMDLAEDAEDEDASLDDEKSFAGAGIEQLWRFLLSTKNEALVEVMIRILNDIYIESRVIQKYPYERTRQIHLHVVDRCIHQMQAAAGVLKADQNGGGSNDSAALDSEVSTNERRIFTRSLAVLQAFLKAYRASPRFSAPDIRSLMAAAPSQIQGESAGLKYQSFSGVSQSDIMPLAIGTKNTAGSLLATLKEATGFENYRVYYKGNPFNVSKDDISKSLEELQIQPGLLLVRKELSGADAPAKAKPGTCGLEIEVLQHFQPLWTYLSMEPTLARQVYYFLVNLPADAGQLELIDSPSSAHHDIFPKGEPYKCLYAAYALDQYLNTAQKSKAPVIADDEQGEEVNNRALVVLARAWALIVDAISDTELLVAGNDVLPKHQLSDTLMQLYLRTLNESFARGQITIPEGRVPTVSCVMDLVRSALAIPRHDHSTGLAQKSFAALLQTSVLSKDFWVSFQMHPDTVPLVEDIMIHEQEPSIRRSAAETIRKRAYPDSPILSVPPRAFQEFFWPVLSALMGKAATLPNQCKEYFTLFQTLLKSLCDEKEWGLMRPERLVSDCSLILQDYETTEELGVPYVEDVVVNSLAIIMHSTLFSYGPSSVNWEFPPKFAERIFWQHLFPRTRKSAKEPVPRSVLCYHTRLRLYSILLIISEHDEAATIDLVKALCRLTSFDGGEDEPYNYELPQCLDRMLEVRAQCGYAGLRNLGNTCYLNSLLTQLFMNTSFRGFMIDAPIKDEDSQELLLETRRLFCKMQDTIRRYVDTHAMVSTIRTYDDTGIDVGVQMDVDEFYNLLFDRWEGQLSTPAERQTFRTFYGGQLVQQVSSKECEHISERFEPFSAIQCDIKGKKNLTESLQAYVDGEVMQGDNKYKCSTCDRHVDAVKRACLKDVPDNLIFHLKRFDFNLRTMMRSKINDYFSFPPTIDMRPYTIEHLSGSTEKLEPDMFELVGVLVHAGTAESGHYYSYIRQRPNTGERDMWLEFNDDIVTAWDPENMEDATFGSAEARSFEHGGFSYEKSNNAYMLFYQRSSTLAAQRSAMQSSALVAPLRAEPPEDIMDQILTDNVQWLRRWCLFDPHHSQFTNKLAERILASSTKSCPLQHRLQDRMMEALLGVFDQAATRSKDLIWVEALRLTAQSAVENCNGCAMALVRYMFQTQEPLKALVQRNADASVRSQSVQLFMAAVKRLREHDPDAYGISVRDPETYDIDSTVAGMCGILFEVLWSNFHINTRSWTETFGLILEFAQLGGFETAMLLNEDWLWRVMMVVATDNSFPHIPDHFRRLLVVLSRRALNRPANYTGPINLIRHFVTALVPRATSPHTIVDAEDRLALYLADSSKPLPWSRTEVAAVQAQGTYMHGSVFLRRLLEVDQAPESVDVIINVFARGGRLMRGMLFEVLDAAVDERAEVASIKPFLRAALAFVEADPASESSIDLARATMEAFKQSRSQATMYAFFFTELDGRLQAVLPLETRIRWAADWAPALLASSNKNMADQVEAHVLEELLSEAEHEIDVTPQTAVAKAVCELGSKCLAVLRRDFCQRAVTRVSISNLQRVIEQCEGFFRDEPGESSVPTRGNFNRVRNEIYTTLHASMVEELDDDGSDWDSPGQYESLADAEMHAVSELADVAMQ